MQPFMWDYVTFTFLELSVIHYASFLGLFVAGNLAIVDNDVQNE